MVVEKVRINSRIVIGLNSAFIRLNTCRIARFHKAIAKVTGFGKASIAEDVLVNDIKYWRTVTFSQEGERNINISFPYLNDKSVLKSPIEFFADSIVDINAVEALARRITEELIKANQT